MATRFGCPNTIQSPLPSPDSIDVKDYDCMIEGIEFFLKLEREILKPRTWSQFVAITNCTHTTSCATSIGLRVVKWFSFVGPAHVGR